MAVRIDIPNFGTVVAEDAATESTLQNLVRAIQAQTARRVQADNKAAESLNETAQAAASTAASMGTVSSQTRTVSDSIRSFATDINDKVNEVASNYPLMSMGLRSLGQGFNTLLLTVSKATVAYATNYRQLSTNPVRASADMLATGIDIATTAATAVGRGLDLVGTKLMRSLNPIGLFGGVLAKIAGTALQHLSPVLGVVANKLNDVFAEELDQTINNFRSLSRSGALFGNGMLEMRIAANKAGVLVDQFANAIQAADKSVRSIGSSFAGGAQLVSETAYYFTRLGDETGDLRTQMLNLGYSFEEQIELTADYLASVRAGTTAERMRNLNFQEVARNTRIYAEDLRVLQALTREDAKGLQEQARARALEADILARLDPESAQRFQGVLRAMPAELQKGFLEQLSLGTVVDAATNVYMSQNSAVRDMFNQMQSIIYGSNMSLGEAQDAMLEQRSIIAQEQRRLSRDGDVAISQAARVGVGGIAESVATMINSIIAGTLNDPQTVEETRKAAQLQAEGRDSLTKQTNAMISASQKFALTMENNVLNYLDKYSGLLKTVNDTMLGFVQGILGYFGIRKLDLKAGEVTGVEADGKTIIDAIGDFFKGASEATPGNNEGNMRGDFESTGELGLRAPQNLDSILYAQNTNLTARQLSSNEPVIDYNQLALAIKDSIKFDVSSLELKLETLKSSQETGTGELKTILEDSRDKLSQIAKSSSSSADYADRSYRMAS